MREMGFDCWQKHSPARYSAKCAKPHTQSPTVCCNWANLESGIPGRGTAVRDTLEPSRLVYGVDERELEVYERAHEAESAHIAASVRESVCESKAQISLC